MDDGFALCPKNANIDVFRKLLNELHPSLKFTVEKGKNSCEQNFDTLVQVLNFLDVSHMSHMTILIILTKQIIVFISDEEKMNERLSELKTWLLSCSYPLTIIEKAFFNAKLQGPAPNKEEIVIHLYQHIIAILIRKVFPLQLIRC